jgi:hypothetical protein
MASNPPFGIYLALLFLLLAASLVLSQTGGPLSWQASQTSEQNSGTAINARNSLRVTLADPATVSVSVSSCPEGWVCAPTPTSFDHAGGDFAYDVGALIVAPADANGTVSVSAVDSLGNSAGEWTISVAPPPVPEEQPVPLEPELPVPGNGEPVPGGKDKVPPGFVGISGCGKVFGNAFLTQDIVAEAEYACLILTTNAVLDCGGHNIAVNHVAIAVDNADDAVVRNCHTTDSSEGLSISFSSRVQVINSTFDTISRSVFATSSPEFSFVDSKAGGLNTRASALSLDDSPSSLVSGSELTADSNNGLLITASDSVSVRSSKITTVGVHDSSGLSIQDSEVGIPSQGEAVYIQMSEGRDDISDIQILSTKLDGSIAASKDGEYLTFEKDAGGDFVLDSLEREEARQIAVGGG